MLTGFCSFSDGCEVSIGMRDRFKDMWIKEDDCVYIYYRRMGSYFVF